MDQWRPAVKEPLDDETACQDPHRGMVRDGPAAVAFAVFDKPVESAFRFAGQAQRVVEQVVAAVDEFPAPDASEFQAQAQRPLEEVKPQVGQHCAEDAVLEQVHSQVVPVVPAAIDNRHIVRAAPELRVLQLAAVVPAELQQALPVGQVQSKLRVQAACSPPSSPKEPCLNSPGVLHCRSAPVFHALLPS